MKNTRGSISWIDIKSKYCPQQVRQKYPGLGTHKIKKGDSVKAGLYRTQGARLKTVDFWCVVNEVRPDGELQVLIDEDLSTEWDCRKGQSLLAQASAILDVV